VCSWLPPETIEVLKAILNRPDNVKIDPASIYENVCSFLFILYIVHVQLLQKQEVMLAAPKKIKQDLNLKHLVG
jgi:hypothetical protein